MKLRITYSYFTSLYSVHVDGCRQAIARHNCNSWPFPGTIDGAVADCVRQEMEKGDDASPEIIAERLVRVCPCARKAAA